MKKINLIFFLKMFKQIGLFIFGSFSGFLSTVLSIFSIRNQNILYRKRNDYI